MKIGCFGMSCAVDSALSQHVMRRTTTLFSAPEWSRGIACLKSDVWSLGLTVVRLALWKSAACNQEFAVFMGRLRKGDELSFPPEWSSNLVGFVKKCLVRDVEKRASVEELLKVHV